MKLIALFFIFSTLFFQVRAQDYAINNVFNNTLLYGRYHGALIGSVFNSSYQFTLLGNEDAGFEIQEMVFMLKKEMNIERGVYVKRMNEKAFSLFGYENAFATHNTLFIDEEWVLNLNYDSRRCLLAHELSHIKNWDIVRQYMLHIILTAMSINMPSIASFIISCISVPFIMSFHKRSNEKTADYEAGCVVGQETMREFLKDSLIDESHDGLKQWFLSLFAHYPSQQERIDYLSNDIAPTLSAK